MKKLNFTLSIIVTLALLCLVSSCNSTNSNKIPKGSSYIDISEYIYTTSADIQNLADSHSILSYEEEYKSDVSLILDSLSEIPNKVSSEEKDSYLELLDTYYKDFVSITNIYTELEDIMCDFSEEIYPYVSSLDQLSNSYEIAKQTNYYTGDETQYEAERNHLVDLIASGGENQMALKNIEKQLGYPASESTRIKLRSLYPPIDVSKYLLQLNALDEAWKQKQLIDNIYCEYNELHEEYLEFFDITYSKYEPLLNEKESLINEKLERYQDS